MKRISIIFTAILFLIGCNDETPFAGHTLMPLGDNELSPRPMTRAEAMNLVLSQGVGYGYNGVEGEECNVPDVRSQVLDPNAIINAGITVDINKVEDNKINFSSAIGFSLNELLEKVYFGGNGSAELAVVFKGSVRGTLMLYSQKKINSYYCTAQAYKNGFYSMIDGPSVSAAIDEHPEILTKNFRSAIARLGKNPTKMQMDSLVNRYGTHVVTKCTLGGMLNLDVRLEKDSIVSISQQNAIGEVALMSLFNHDSQSSNDEFDLKIINSGDSRLSVRGGDSRKLEQTLMNFNWGRDAIKPQDIDDWLESIGTDEDKQQTLEMTSMEMMPIWEFIPDPDVARRLEAHITGNAQIMCELYGYQNFVNTSFPARPAQPEPEEWYLINEQKRVIQTPLRNMCFNVEAGGRYVATLCYENIPEIDSTDPVWVAYPIYQQQVNISTGLCIHKGKAYRVGWRFGEMEVTPIKTEGISQSIYMTGGYLYPMPTQGIDYEQSLIVTGYEWPGGIRTNGTLATDKPIYTIYKENDLFLLRDIDGLQQQGSLSALPNWTYDSSLNRMVRNDDYCYYYNPQEVNYINSHPEIYPDIIRIKTNGWLTGNITKPVYVTGGTNLTLYRAKIEKGVIAEGANITLNLDDVTISGQIDCRQSTTINLNPYSNNSVTANQSGLSAIRCASGLLTIKGYGRLTAVGGEGAAGIGSNMNEFWNNSEIKLDKANVTTYGGVGGAAIGSGSGGSCGRVTIYSSDLKAYSSGGGAGVGAGRSGRCGDIIIRGSNVDIQARDHGAGVGSGSDGSSCGAIWVYNSSGEISASDKAAGIGSGYNNSYYDELFVENCYIYIEAGTWMGAGVGSEGGEILELLGPPL